MQNVGGLGLRQAWKNIIASIRLLNLFKSHSTNQADLNRQYIHTRVYLLLLITCIAILLFRTSIIERSGTLTISSPSSNDYKRLLDLYPNSVNCPCTHISIPYGEFMTELRVTSFHQVCSTSTLSSILTVGGKPPLLTFQPGDAFNAWRGTFLDGINGLCSIAQDYIGNSTQIFRSSPMLSYQMIPRTAFDGEVDVTVSNFQKALSITFTQLLDLLRSIVQGNALISMVPANWNVTVVDNTTLFRSEPVTHAHPDTNATCSCATDRFCSTPTVVHDRVQDKIIFTPPGIVFGCALLESVLQSSLTCFYSLACVNETRTLMGFRGSVKDWMERGYTLALNASSTHFALNDTLETLAYAVFIESWTSEASYERFFNACAPSHCTGTYHYRFDALELLTTFLSVYSGLVMALRFLTPHCVSLVSRVRNRIRPS